ncbi:MAG: hypothetical protein WCK70_05405 [Chloroflexales bacterium]
MRATHHWGHERLQFVLGDKIVAALPSADALGLRQDSPLTPDFDGLRRGTLFSRLTATN